MIKKTIIWVIIVSLCMISGPIYAEEAVEIKNVQTYFLNQGTYSNIDYMVDTDTIYMQLDELLRVTNYSCEYANTDQVFELQRGRKTVVLDRRTNQIQYDNLIEPMAEWVEDGELLWVPMYPTLLYLNTSAEVLNEDTLMMVVAEDTLYDFISDFYQLIKSEKHLIYYGQDRSTYKLELAVASISDVFRRGKAGNALTGEYTASMFRQVLLKTLEQDFQSTKEKQHLDISQGILKEVIDSRWFQEMDISDQLRIVEISGVIDALNHIDNYLGILDNYEAIKALSVENIEILNDSVLKARRKVGNKYTSPLFSETEKIVNYYRLQATEGLMEDLMMKAASDVTNLAVEKGLGFTNALKLYLNIVNATTKPFIQDEHSIESYILRHNFYVIQDMIVNHFYDGWVEAQNVAKVDQDLIDSLYALPKLYLMLAETVDAELHGEGVIKRHREALGHYMNYRKNDLMLDSPLLNTYRISGGELLAMNEAPPMSLMGNTNGNIANDGRVALKNNYIYYSSVDDHGRLYKQNLDTRESDRLTTGDWCLFINVTDEHVYFTSDTGVYRIDLDGNNKMKISEHRGLYLQVVGPWIFYQTEYYGGDILRMNKDGSGRIKIVENTRGNFAVNEGWIYYSSEDGTGVENESLYKVRVDGTERILLSNDEYISFIIAEGNYVYYIIQEIEWILREGGLLRPLSYNHSIIRIDSDGQNRFILADDIRPSPLNVSGNWVFFHGDGMYKIMNDGTHKTKLSSLYFAMVYIIGDWIYYIKFKPDYEGPETPYEGFYRVKKDGSDKQLVQ